jgi:hypothetical protein
MWTWIYEFIIWLFKNSLFWLVDKRSVKTHISGPWSVFSVSGPVSRMSFSFLNFQLCFTDKNFKQPHCFWLSMHAYRILLPSETDDSRFNSREKHMLTDSVRPYQFWINRLLTSLVRSVLWNIRPLFFAWTSLLRRSVHTKKPRSDISQYRPHARSISR